MTSSYVGGPPVGRSEPHWYRTIYVEGCVLCSAGSETIRVRMPGARPVDPAECYEHDNTPTACGSHFA
jgi:hypothetical protein